MSQKFVENLRKVGRSPRLLGAVTAADALVGLRFECVGNAGRGRPPHNEICHEPLGQETSSLWKKSVAHRSLTCAVP